jgi:hypothetical protein
MTHFRSLWTGMTQHDKFKDRQLILLFIKSYSYITIGLPFDNFEETKAQEHRKRIFG